MSRKGLFHKWLTKEGLLKLEGWARDGLTDEQIAHNIGIRRETLYTWKRKYDNLDHALKKGKEVIDYEVENALLNRALGYDYEEVKTHIEDSGNGKKKRVEKTTKHVPADVTAGIFWLKNRKPKEWRDRQNIEHEGDVKINIIDNIKRTEKE